MFCHITPSAADRRRSLSSAVPVSSSCVDFAAICGLWRRRAAAAAGSSWPARVSLSSRSARVLLLPSRRRACFPDEAPPLTVAGAGRLISARRDFRPSSLHNAAGPRRVSKNSRRALRWGQSIGARRGGGGAGRGRGARAGRARQPGGRERRSS